MIYVNWRETKIIPFESNKIIGKVNKKDNSIENYNRRKNLTDIYLRCENIPILWKKIFVRIANEVYRERHFVFTI